MNADQRLEWRQLRRMQAEDRALARIERLEAAAYAMVGELCREGQQVFYVCPPGGKYREGARADLIAFLIRNRYVT
jgi:hypothetical protein